MSAPDALKKTKTGIPGLDEITEGGVPSGRPTLICGGPGCGKSLLAFEFLIHGAADFGQPGIFVSFEESAQDILTNFSSLAFDVEGLMQAGRLDVLHIEAKPQDFEETGPFDLEGLFVRLDRAINRVQAKRVVLDTLENVFGGIRNHVILRAELRRLFSWLKERGVTAIVTGERGSGTLTRQGLEEYASDCVIFLDHRVTEQISTRRLRIIKYRGSLHGSNEYPFLIDEQGLALFPVTALALNHKASKERVSTGVDSLDELLGGQGYYRGSTVLISGPAGSGKTSLAFHFANAAVQRGERTLYFAFEESPQQLIRNLGSIGMELESCVSAGLLQIIANRPSFYGLEMHLLKINNLVNQFRPRNVILDPFTNFTAVGSRLEVQVMLTRMIDFLKANQITTILTSLTESGHAEGGSEMGISAWIDSWLLLREVESSGERNRVLYVLKSRGMPHSNQVREFLITSKGVQLSPVYLGQAGMLTGSARVAQLARERAEAGEREQAFHVDRLRIEQKQKALAAKIAALQAELALTENEMGLSGARFQQGKDRLERERSEMAASRDVEKPESSERKAG